MTRIQQLEELLNIAKILGSNLDFNKMADSLLLSCMGSVKVEKAALYIKRNISAETYTLYRNFHGIEVRGQKIQKIETESPLVQFFISHPQPATMPELMEKLEHPNSLAPFAVIEPAIIIPMVAKADLLGMILIGEKIDESPFNPEDRRFLSDFAALAALAVQNAYLFMQSTTDSMTGLKLRHVFVHNLERALVKNDNFSLLMLDIDHFKTVNDSYGHQAGDEILRVLGQILMENVRSQDIVCRYGGEEFIILLPGLKREKSLAIAERIRQTVEKTTFHFKELRIKCTISIGGMEHSTEVEDSVPSLIERADKALYKAKHQGRNKTVFPG
jgi:two-component system cell cycle response regulator